MSDVESAERDRWFSMALIELGAVRREDAYSSHALLLELDARLAFRAGAWLSVITICFAAVEAQYRQVHKQDYDSCANSLFGSDLDLQWLRKIRNQISHAGEPGTPSE